MRRLPAACTNFLTCLKPHFKVNGSLLTSHDLTNLTLVTSTCLVVMLEELQAGVQKVMSDLCKGRKKCVALVRVSQEEDIRLDPPPEQLAEQQRFSLQPAWVVVKRVARGHIVRLTCSGRERVWLQHSGLEESGQIRRRTTHDLDQEIFKGWTLDPTCFSIETSLLGQFAISQSQAPA